MSLRAYPMTGRPCPCVRDRPCCYLHSMPFGGDAGIDDFTTRLTPDGPECSEDKEEELNEQEDEHEGEEEQSDQDIVEGDDENEGDYEGEEDYDE